MEEIKWQIVKDYDDDSELVRLGKFKGSVKDDPDIMGDDAIRVRTTTDDGHHAYEAMCKGEDSAEDFHDWSTRDYGTTQSEIQYHGGEWTPFIS